MTIGHSLGVSDIDELGLMSFGGWSWILYRFVGIGARLRPDFWISWFSLSWSSVRSYGWIVVSDVWMNRWVLKKFSRDTFNGLADYVKDIKQKVRHMYVCVPHVRKTTTHRDCCLS